MQKMSYVERWKDEKSCPISVKAHENGLPSGKSGSKIIRPWIMDAEYADTVDGSSSQMRSHSVTFTPGQENRLVYSTRLTCSQNMLNATTGRAADILSHV